MAPRVEGLLEEAQKEAEEVVAEAEVISLLGEWMLGIPHIWRANYKSYLYFQLHSHVVKGQLCSPSSYVACN